MGLAHNFELLRRPTLAEFRAFGEDVRKIIKAKDGWVLDVPGYYHGRPLRLVGSYSEPKTKPVVTDELVRFHPHPREDSGSETFWCSRKKLGYQSVKWGSMEYSQVVQMILVAMKYRFGEKVVVGSDFCQLDLWINQAKETRRLLGVPNLQFRWKKTKRSTNGELVIGEWACAASQ